MLITLLTGTTYDLSKAHRRKCLKSYMPRLQLAEIAHIATQIEEAKVVDIWTQEIYGRLPDRRVVHKTFDGLPLRHGDRFICIESEFYALPHVKSDEYLGYALIDKLLELTVLFDWPENPKVQPDASLHPSWNQSPCLPLRKAIQRFLPDSFDKKAKALQKNLLEEEEKKGTYFADYLSEDSDSEAEVTFQASTKLAKEASINRAKCFRKRAKSQRYHAKLLVGDTVPKPDFIDRPRICRGDLYSQNRRTVKDDLDAVNARITAGKRLTPEFLARLDTKFSVAQYRGIHYLRTTWGAKARRQHRCRDEVGQAQYTSAVLRNCGVDSYQEYVDKLAENPVAFEAQLSETAKTLERLLLLMQHTPPKTWKGYTFLSLFHLMQYWYSENYDAFPERIEADLGKVASHFKDFLETGDRPLLSTSDLPYHALKYAYGVKLYDGHKDKRLRPRWREDGRAERPYSGKVYASLHPLRDYTEKSPSHLTSFFKHGFMPLVSNIVVERETSFLAHLPKGRVFMQHVAKYPSFKGKYKACYDEKYGITEEMYKKIQTGLQNFAPHSTRRKHLKRVLGEYFCAYQEVRMIALAREQANREGAVLLYRDEDGLFALEHPDTPTMANRRLRPLVNAERKLYRALSPDKKHSIQSLTKTDARARLAKEIPDEVARQNGIISLLFDHKKRMPRLETVSPMPVLTAKRSP